MVAPATFLPGSVSERGGGLQKPEPSRLFEPFRSGQLALRNRIVMSPMSRYRSPGGVPDGAVVRYYRRRAAAGIGLIISEGTYIDHPGAAVYPKVPHFFGDCALAGWRDVLAAVHAEGASMMPQLWHVGNARRLGAPPDAGVPGFGPDEIRQDERVVVTRIDEEDIEAIADSYARSATAARTMGFDGVTLHGGHGYLLDQFLWSGSNGRHDNYGGSLEKRCRFAARVVARIRAAVGAEFPIVFRFSQWKANDYNARIAETPAQLHTILDLLVQAGVTIFDVSARRFWEPAFPNDPRSLPAWTRELSGRPVIAVGSIGLDQPHQSKFYRTADNVAAKVTDLRMVEEALARGDFDLAAVGRAILADPEWPEKVRRGAFDEITPFSREAMENYT